MCQQAVIGMGRRAKEAEALGVDMGMPLPPQVFQGLHHMKLPQPSAEPLLSLLQQVLCSY